MDNKVLSCFEWERLYFPLLVVYKLATYEMGVMKIPYQWNVKRINDSHFK